MLTARLCQRPVLPLLPMLLVEAARHTVDATRRALLFKAPALPVGRHHPVGPGTRPAVRGGGRRRIAMSAAWARHLPVIGVVSAASGQAAEGDEGVLRWASLPPVAERPAGRRSMRFTTLSVALPSRHSPEQLGVRAARWCPLALPPGVPPAVGASPLQRQGFANHPSSLTPTPPT